ncbi:MAG: ORF6N domain-containing protein, partial [Bacteroidetes bacterium]|nr:ORF6N domain-containing protein [Bacteroidota bacterium]
MPNSQNQIVHKIVQVRGVNIILDKDIAPMYGVSTKALNQAVKRNSSRFPETFMFRLTDEETEFSRSQIVTLNNTSPIKRGQNIKYNPFAFTEMGVAMLSAILKSDIAIAISIEIIQVFTELRKSNQQKLILTNRIERAEKQLLDHELKLDKILQNSLEPAKHHQGIFFNNQIFDAYAFSSDLIKSAKKSIVLLDNYIDESTLLQLSKRDAN